MIPDPFLSRPPAFTVELRLITVIPQEKRQDSIKYKIFILKMSRRKQIKTIQTVWSLAYRDHARSQQWRR